MILSSVRVEEMGSAMGQGVVATEQIPKGTIVWVHDDVDVVVPLYRLRRLPRTEQVDWQRFGWVWDEIHGCLCGDAARYVNHACEPNTQTVAAGATIAVRDIEAGEQLTEDYAFLNRRYGFVCRCGSPRCRGRVRPTCSPVDRALLADAVGEVSKVPQPLWPRLDAELQTWMDDISSGRQSIPPLSTFRLDAPVMLERYLTT